MSKTDNKKSTDISFRSYKGLMASVLLIVCVAIIFSVNVFTSSGAVEWARGLFVSNGIVRDGSLDVEGIEQLEDVPEGEVRFFINKKVVFENTYEKGNIMLQNPKNCDYILEFRFYLAEENTNKPIYTSARLKPGQYLSGDKLDRKVEDGTHDCSYIVRAYAVDEPDKLMGEQSGFLTLTIED